MRCIHYTWFYEEHSELVFWIKATSFYHYPSLYVVWYLAFVLLFLSDLSPIKLRLIIGYIVTIVTGQLYTVSGHIRTRPIRFCSVSSSLLDSRILLPLLYQERKLCHLIFHYKYTLFSIFTRVFRQFTTFNVLYPCSNPCSKRTWK